MPSHLGVSHQCCSLRHLEHFGGDPIELGTPGSADIKSGHCPIRDNVGSCSPFGDNTMYTYAFRQMLPQGVNSHKKSDHAVQSVDSLFRGVGGMGGLTAELKLIGIKCIAGGH